MSTPLREPAEKLSLMTRKSLRDEYEAKKPEWEEMMNTLLGESWSIETNPRLIVQYAEYNKNELGETIAQYLDGFVFNLKRFVEDYGDDGVQELNTTCSRHQVLLVPQEQTLFSYGGMVIDSEGTLRVVFAQDCFGVNAYQITEDFATPLAQAPAGSTAFSIRARHAVRKDYDPQIDKVRSDIARLVNMPTLRLNPNFEANAAELKRTEAGREAGREWDKQIGWVTLEYFLSLREVLQRNRFGDDDMLQEGFQEAVARGEVCVRVLQKWEDGGSRYNEIKAEEGVLYLQTIPDNWARNVNGIAMGLLEIL